MRNLKICFLILGICLISYQFVSAQTDHPADIMCTSYAVYECGSISDCSQISIEDTNIPSKFVVDFEELTVSAAEETGRDEASSIMNFVNLQDRWILQGMENSKGWSMLITKETGQMSLTVSGDQQGIVLFGSCTQ